MKKILSVSFDSIACLGLCFFLILSTIDGVLTTNVSLGYILFLRHISWIGLFTCVSVLILWRRSFKGVWEVSVPLSVLLLWASGLTYFYSFDSYELSDFAYVLVACIQGVLGAYLLSICSPSALGGVPLYFFNGYGVFTFLLILTSGGLSFEYPASFNFGVLSEIFGVRTLYSQGMSRLFGFAAIFYALGLASSTKNHQRLMHGALLLGSIFLCLLGGARGESFFAIILVICICLWRYRLPFLFWSTVVVLGLHLAVTDWSWLSDFVVFQRYSVLGGGADVLLGSGGGADVLLGSEGGSSRYGYREVLLRQSYRLFSDNPECLFLGCGLGYFQKYYNYSLAMHPHNELVEFAITHGVFLAVFVSAFVVLGLREFVRHQRQSAPLAFLYIYSLLLALKGGTIFSNGLFLALSLYYFLLAERLMIHWLRGHGSAVGGIRY
jgi:hypothetical protein